jgi:hypothetical protein
VGANNHWSIKLEQAVPENEPIPGAIIAVQAFDNFIGFKKISNDNH